MQVRRATAADAGGIARVHVASWQVAYRGFFPDDVLDNLSPADREKQWSARLAGEHPGVLVAEHDSQVIGFIFTCPSRDADAPPPDFAELAALYVHPAAWATGCGQALCAAAFAELRPGPAQTVNVWVLTANVRARRFYERVGFVADDARKDITLYGITLPEVRYRLSLR